MGVMELQNSPSGNLPTGSFGSQPVSHLIPRRLIRLAPNAYINNFVFVGGTAVKLIAGIFYRHCCGKRLGRRVVPMESEPNGIKTRTASPRMRPAATRPAFFTGLHTRIIEQFHHRPRVPRDAGPHGRRSAHHTTATPGPSASWRHSGLRMSKGPADHFLHTFLTRRAINGSGVCATRSGAGQSGTGTARRAARRRLYPTAGHRARATPG
jgi:hypothetical protein